MLSILAPRQQTLKALQGLRDIVLKGEVEAGERLSEVALSTRLDVSRTPLRTSCSGSNRKGLSRRSHPAALRFAASAGTT
ncbi:GntR family transcriptional regulator [Rhizobium beringeri]